jgi:hypothetical protein
MPAGLSRFVHLIVQPRLWAGPYVAVWFLVGFLPIQPTDLDIFFWPSAQIAVAGHPLLVYSPGGQDAYPNANGPVALAPLTVVGLVVRAFGWLNAYDERRAFALAAFSLFVLLMAREGIAAIDRLRGDRLVGVWRLLAYAALATAPPVWQSVVGYGHIEQPMEIWLALLAVRFLGRERTYLAGLAYGLAVLSRSSAVLLVIPLALAAWRRRPTRAVQLLTGTAVTGVAVLLPFFLADRANVTHSLFTYRGGLPIGAGSIWALERGGTLEPLVQHWDLALVAAVALAANLWLASRPGGLTEDRLFAGMTLTAAAFALLAKTVWPYYFFEVFVFGTVWAAGRWRPGDGIVRIALLPVMVSTFGLVSEIGPEPGLGWTEVNIEGAGMFALLGLLIGWVAWWAARPVAGMSAGPGGVQEVWKPQSASAPRAGR